MSDINQMNVGPRWYVAHTYSGYENKVKANLEKIIENRGLEDLIFDVRIPVEVTIEKKGDKEVEVENKIFPSYVLVKMIMTEETWHVVRNITGVTGFVGPGSNPTPLSQAEVEGLALEEKKVKLPFELWTSSELSSFLPTFGKMSRLFLSSFDSPYSVSTTATTCVLPVSTLTSTRVPA